jgi:hypothetical protein
MRYVDCLFTKMQRDCNMTIVEFYLIPPKQLKYIAKNCQEHNIVAIEYNITYLHFNRIMKILVHMD